MFIQLDYQLDGNAPLTETNSTTAQVNLYGNGLVMSGGETLLSDGLGATRQTTNSSQSVVWSGTSQAYGVPLASSGSTVNHYQWGAGSGYRTDGFGPTYASPLVKVGARYYDPEFGCFLSRDTDLSQSPYVYCNGDPVNQSDPTGHESALPPTFETTGSTGIIELPGNGSADDSDISNPYPGLSDSGTSGVTGGVSTSGLNRTVSLMFPDGVGVMAGANNGQPNSVGTSGSFPFGGGFSGIFSETANQNSALNQQTGGLSFKDGDVTLSGSANSAGGYMFKAGVGFQF